METEKTTITVVLTFMLTAPLCICIGGCVVEMNRERAVDVLRIDCLEKNVGEYTADKKGKPVFRVKPCNCGEQKEDNGSSRITLE